MSDPAVAAGYWNQPARSQEIFGAYLKETGEGPWLRTGDLGFLQNGELFISGRLKDMIIIRGANFAPQDIEWVSQKCHPAVESAESAAFSLTIDGEESLGVVQELNRKDHPSNIEVEDVAARIREQDFFGIRGSRIRGRTGQAGYNSEDVKREDTAPSVPRGIVGWQS